MLCKWVNDWIESQWALETLAIGTDSYPDFAEESSDINLKSLPLEEQSSVVSNGYRLRYGRVNAELLYCL